MVDFSAFRNYLKNYLFGYSCPPGPSPFNMPTSKLEDIFPHPLEFNENLWYTYTMDILNAYFNWTREIVICFSLIIGGLFFLSEIFGPKLGKIGTFLMHVFISTMFLTGMFF